MKFRDFSGLTLYFCNPYIPGDVTNNSEVNDFNTLLPRLILTIMGKMMLVRTFKSSTV